MSHIILPPDPGLLGQRHNFNVIPLMESSKLLLFASLLALVACENCTNIIHYRSSQSEYLFRNVQWSIMPEKSASCVNGACTYKQQFGCINPDNFQPLACSLAQAQSLFPYCAGKAVVDAHCSTWSCCENLNHEVLDYITAQWGSYNVEFNYQLLLYSSSTFINCHSYSPTSGPCLQWLRYAASSDWDTCMQLQKNFDSADSMAFSLF